MSWECKNCGYISPVDEREICIKCGEKRNPNIENESSGRGGLTTKNQVSFPNRNFPKNSTAQTFRVLSVLIVLGGFIAGILFGQVQSGFFYYFSLDLAIIYWSSGFIIGMIFVGFAEVITLLQVLVYQNRDK